MSQPDWRNLHWKNLNVSQKRWFAAMCLSLVALLTGAVLAQLELIHIPDAVVLAVALAAAYTAYRVVDELNLFNDQTEGNEASLSDENDEDESE